MRISLVLPDLPVGGAERAALTLAREFILFGHELAVCLLHTRGELVSAARTLPARLCDLSMISLLRAPAAIRRLARFLAEWRPDVVYPILWSATVAAGSAAYAARRHARMITVEHNLPSWYAPRVRYGSLKLRAVMCVHRRADRVIVPSVLVREDLIGLGLHPDRVVVIPNPVPVPQGVAPIDQEPSRPLVVACAARLFRHKGIDRVIRAIAILQSMGVDAVLRVAGEGPRRAELEALAADLGIADRVLFLGWVRDMSSFYKESHVVVHAAESESFGLVVAEAMAHGRPVVVTPALLKSLSFLAPGENALITSGAPEAIARCLYEAVRTPGYLRGLAERGLRDVARVCDPRAVAQAYLEAAEVAG